MLVAFASCREVIPPKDTMYDCEAFEIYSDSIVRDGKVYKALSDTEITNSWKADSINRSAPSYHSPQLMADALFCKAIQETPYFSPLHIYLSLAALYPEKSMESLKALVTKGKITASDFPVSAGNAAWAAAAWELYCVTGDRTWLREAYNVITATLRKELPVRTSSQPPLIYGTPDYFTPHADYYPSWMGPINRFQTISTGVNALHAYTYDILSEMASELGLKAPDNYKKRANAIRGAINDLLWIPNLGYYGQYLYGAYYPLLSHSADHIANSLCVLFDIATPEMASSIVAHSPVLSNGTPLVYPSIHAPKNDNALVEALRILSAAKVRNESAAIASIGALWNLSIDHPTPAETQAMVIKGLLGMQFTPKGIMFSPVVPSRFPGKKTLKDFRYRDATLSVNIHGTGDKIAGFYLDSVSISPALIPPNLTGSHNIDITLSGNNLPLTDINIVKSATLPKVPKIKWQLPNKAQIMDFTPGFSYGIYVNGTFLEEIQSNTYTYTPKTDAILNIVPIAEQEYIGFSPESHVIASDSSVINIPASSITPRRTPMHLIKQREIATKYIELAARHNTRITFYANAPAAGEYFITIGYSNGTNSTALRTLTVNGKDVGIVTCPSIRHNDWITVYPSNTLTVKLNSGPNLLALTYINTTILLNKITLLRKN